MTLDLAKLKAALRGEVQAKLEALSDGARVNGGNQLRDRLRASELWQTAKSVLFFAPLEDEPDLWPLIAEALAANKLVALPRFISRTRGYVACQIQNLSGELAIGNFRVREPLPACPEVPLDGFDLVLVPGVAFDARGGRLGRGKGYYDQLLANVRGAACGVAFDEQLVAEIPVESHDRRVNCVLTPTRWIVASRND
jgi:5-formyltetrahydrofolate cyclo-ligase